MLDKESRFLAARGRADPVGRAAASVVTRIDIFGGRVVMGRQGLLAVNSTASARASGLSHQASTAAESP